MQEKTIKSLEQIEQELSSFRKKIEDDYQQIEDSHRQIIVSQQNVQQLERERGWLLKKASDETNTENQDQEMMSATPVALQCDSDKKENKGFYTTWDPRLIKKISDNKGLSWQHKRWLKNPSKMKRAENIYSYSAQISVAAFFILLIAGLIVNLCIDPKTQPMIPLILLGLLGANVIVFFWGGLGLRRINALKDLIIDEQKNQMSWRGGLRGTLIEKRLSKNKGKNMKAVDQVYE